MVQARRYPGRQGREAERPSDGGFGAARAGAVHADIETAENAVGKMQKALSAAMKAESQNKNAAETGDAKFSKNNTKRSATSPLSGSPATQGSVGMAHRSVTAAAEHLGIKVNLSQVSDYVKSAIAIFSDVLDAISNKTQQRRKTWWNCSSESGICLQKRTDGCIFENYRTGGKCWL